MAVIPAALLTLELIGLYLTAGRGGSAIHIPGIFFIQAFSIVGIIALPFLALIFEVIGFVFAVRWKQKPLIIIIAIELGQTFLSMAFTALIVYVGSKV